MDVPPVSLIAAKRDGKTLSAADLKAFISGYTKGDIPDYQMSALLMAAYLKGLDSSEAGALTEAMLESGTRIDLSGVAGTKVGKHSTGGVGDKVSPILVPLVASCGVPVPKISGRGLGHTGGTLDKLESIPGLRTDLSIGDYRDQLSRIGLVLAGQTEEIAPADRKLYALRDVTATVDSIPFIAASIMSKKLAEGIDALVLDVKCGRGAFMQTEAEARALAEALVGIGAEHDTPTTAVMTSMNVPLGRAVGNWPEIEESVACLRGENEDTPLMKLVRTLAGEMIAYGDRASTAEEGRHQARAAIASGAAFDRFRQMVAAQGGDPSIVDDPSSRSGRAPVGAVHAPEHADGYVADLDARAIGQATVELGAGRRTKEDTVDPLAGLSHLKKPGDAVAPGDVLAQVHAGREVDLDAVCKAVLKAYDFSDSSPESSPIVRARFTRAGWSEVGDGIGPSSTEPKISD